MPDLNDHSGWICIALIGLVALLAILQAVVKIANRGRKLEEDDDA